MVKVTYELNGEKATFESNLEYSMIGVINDVVSLPCFNYKQIVDYGNKNKCDVKVIPCECKGKSPYKNSVEEYNHEKHKDFIWVAPKAEIVEDKPQPVLNQKSKKLRKKKGKK